MAIFFDSNIHTAVWGTEDWVVSAHPSDVRTVGEGAEAGRSLRELYPDFPLLFKVIDARSRLSVQVHPNETTCRVTGGDPKTEMWCALADGPIYAGLRAGTTAADVAAAVRSGRFEELLVRHEAKFGDVFFIPGGLVHAIGDGVKLYEVQQSSDTTFRLYDWGRVGLDGQPRELHVEKGLQAIDYTLPAPTAVDALRTPFFDFSQRAVAGQEVLSCGAGEFAVVYAARGRLTVDGRERDEGTSFLLAPDSSATLAADGSRVFVTRFRARACAGGGQ